MADQETAISKIKIGVAITVLSGVILGVSGYFSLRLWPSIGGWLMGVVGGVSNWVFNAHLVPGWLLLIFWFVAMFVVLSVISEIRWYFAGHLRKYTSDSFAGLSWGWTYVKRRPFNPLPFCLKCKLEIAPYPIRDPNSQSHGTQFECERCVDSELFLPAPFEEIQRAVYRLINRNIKQEEWPGAKKITPKLASEASKQPGETA